MPTNPFLVDDSPQSNPLPGGSTGDPTMDQLGIGKGNQFQVPTQDQPQPPGRVKSMLTGFLQGMSDSLKKDAGLETSAEYHQRLLNNQIKQQQVGIEQQNANTNQGYKDLQGQQYGMITVNDADGNPIQIQAKDAGRFASSMAGVQQRQQAKEQSAQVALASKGFKMVTDANGKMSVQPMNPQEQSDFLKSQQSKNQGAANQSNANAAAAPTKAAAAQTNAAANLARAQSSAQRLDATITKQAGKVTSGVQNRAALADNVEENLQLMEEIAKRRPDIFGPVSGRISNAALVAGTDDPDKLAFAQAKSNIIKANMGMHQMRSKYGMEHDLPNLDFKNGTDGLKGTFSAIRSSANQFRNEASTSATPKKGDPLGILR